MRNSIWMVLCAVLLLMTGLKPAQADPTFGVGVVITEPAQGSYTIPGMAANIAVPQSSNHVFSVTGTANQVLSLAVNYTLEVAGFGIGVGGGNPVIVTLNANGLYSSGTTTLSGSHNFGVGANYVTTGFSGVSDNNSAAHNEVQATKSFNVTR